MQIIVEGVSEAQIQKDIKRMTAGWRLFFIEPENVKYQYLNPFWGYFWDGTSSNLKEIILKGAKVDGYLKQHILTFKYNGEDRFAWCSWTKEVYDFNTKIKYQLEGNHLAMKITDLIGTVLTEEEDIHNQECWEALSSIGDTEF